MRRRIGRWALGALLLAAVVGVVLVAAGLGSHSGFAVQGGTAAGSGTGSAVPDLSASTIAGLVLKFGLVVALLGASLWFLRRYARGGPRPGGSDRVMRVLETVPLARGQVLYAVDIGDRALVVGATQQQFSALAEVTDPGVLARMRDGPDGGSPRRALTQWMLGRPVRPVPPRSDEVPAAGAVEATAGTAPPEQTAAHLPLHANGATLHGNGDVAEAVAAGSFAHAVNGARAAESGDGAIAPEVVAHLRALAERLRSGGPHT